MPTPATAKPGLSVFFPAYNDSGTIASMVIRAVQAASELTPDYEVIVVNDGSADATARDRSTSSRAPIRRCASCTTRGTAATAARCRPASDRRPRS